MNSESVGKGFDATYWTIYDSSLYDRKLNNDRNEIQEHNVLVNPIEFKFENDIKYDLVIKLRFDLLIENVLINENTLFKINNLYSTCLCLTVSISFLKGLF
jgi:hypothetical protein